MRKLIPAFAALCLVAFAWAQTTRVGPLPSADSLAINQRVGRTGETIVQASGGGNKERVRRGNCYYASDVGVGVAVGTTVSTTSMLSCYNPSNSATLCIIKKVYCSYFSGTLGTGTIFHCINNVTTQTAPSAGTAQININALLGGPTASLMQVRTGSTVPAPTILAPMMYLAPELATTVTAPQQNWEDLDDAIQLMPGTSYHLSAVAAAGTSPKVNIGVFWEEQPLLNGQP